MPDAKVAAIAAEIRRRGGDELEVVLGQLIRQAIDEVLDGPRRMRWDFQDLEKEEKSYVGKRVELLVRERLRLEPGRIADAVILGEETDVKWSATLGWMIGRENVGRVCLGLGLTDSGRRFSVGVFRPSESNLRKQPNQDKKRQLLASAKATEIEWLVERAPLPPNFVASLAPDVRDAILKERSAQGRMRVLAQRVQLTPIPREAFFTLTGKKDATRRVRRDRSRGDPLGGMLLLSTNKPENRRILAELGVVDPPRDHWVSIPATIEERNS